MKKSEKKIVESVKKFLNYISSSEVDVEVCNDPEVLNAYRETLVDSGLVELDDNGKIIDGDADMIKVYKSVKKLTEMTKPIPYFIDTYTVVIREMLECGDEEFGVIANFNNLKNAEKYVNKNIDMRLSGLVSKDELKKAKKTYNTYTDEDNEFISRVYEIRYSKNSKIRILIEKSQVRASSTYTHPVFGENYIRLDEDDDILQCCSVDDK